MSFPILPTELLERILPELVTWAKSDLGELPERLRTELRSLIPSALVGPVGLREYLESLDSALGDRIFLPPPIDSLPLDRVVRLGLTERSDKQLADLALSPDTFRYVNETICAALLVGTAGQFWEDAELIPDDRIPPDHLPESVLRKSMDHYGSLTRNRTRIEDQPARPINDAKLPTRFRWQRYAAIATALAASLVLGIFLGQCALDGGKQPEFVLADAKLVGDSTRGFPDSEVHVMNSGNARAFVAIVGVARSEQRLPVFNRSGGEFLVAAPKQELTIKSIPPEFKEAISGILVLSNVPAGDAIRANLPDKASASQADDLAERLRRALAALNIHAEVRVVRLSDTKN